jgi:pSer/pThr/pTyr-binding forkhead associated (FHA) protein
MSGATLQYKDKEYPIGDGVTSIGRTPDNHLSFPDDSNVSRYHAEIEGRNGEYVLIDLQSSNGTTVNGRQISREHHSFRKLCREPSRETR